MESGRDRRGSVFLGRRGEELHTLHRGILLPPARDSPPAPPRPHPPAPTPPPPGSTGQMLTNLTPLSFLSQCSNLCKTWNLMKQPKPEPIAPHSSL